MTSQIKYLLLLGLFSCTLIISGLALGGEIGRFVALGIVIVISAGVYWYSDTIALRLIKARKLTEAEAPLLYAKAQELAQKTHMPMPRIYCVPAQSAKSFVAGRNPARSILFVTEGFLQLNNPEELQKKLSLTMIHITKRTVLQHSLINVIGTSIAPIMNILQ